MDDQEMKKKMLEAYAAGFFSSHCSHNGEMVDDIDLAGMGREVYVSEMFNDWITGGLDE